MRRQAIRRRHPVIVCALLLAVSGSVPQSAAAPAAATGAGAHAATPAAIAEYRRKLKEYLEVHGAYEEDARAYWDAIAEKRRMRNTKRRDRQPVTLDDYVLTQPPRYDGPKRPVNPEPEEVRPPHQRKYIPVVADLLKAAAEQFQFAPRRPGSEMDFKRAYAQVAQAYGLTREQAVRVYSFETGGNGGYDMQSGLSSSRPGSRAISTAIGYNQLLTTNSVELVAEQGHDILRVLGEKEARLSGPQRAAMAHKIAVVRRMVAYARSVPDTWSAHEKLADTAQGWAIHALVLDIDVGPILQTHKLLTSVVFARNKGYERPLTGAELEMMNLTGDGTGLDMVTMPRAMRGQVPTSNFFQRRGYERNPVAIRHDTVAKLLAVTDDRMNSNSVKPGAKELAGAF